MARWRVFALAPNGFVGFRRGSLTAWWSYRFLVNAPGVRPLGRGESWEIP